MPNASAARRILITGAGGQVGGALLRTLSPLGELYAPSRTELDLTDAASIRAIVRGFQPHWIVNAAAHTAVDKAESEPEIAFAVNATAPEILGAEAKVCGAIVIHFSTDYVFDGTSNTPYVETDPTGPLGVYGRSKLAGEEALEAGGIPYFVFRTSWVYGASGKNFLLSILRMAREREHLRVVADQRGTPTWSFDLAAMIAHVIGRVHSLCEQEACALSQAAIALSGIYHASGSGETTWFGFAEAAVAELRKREPTTRLASLEPIPTCEYPTPATRPMNSRLNCAKLERTFAWKMPDWHDSLVQVVSSL